MYETPLENGTQCGSSSFCRDGVCTIVVCGDSVVDENEQCDDGNQISADGCEKDCSFSCEMDNDCSDEDICSGIETCDLQTHACVYDPPLQNGTQCGESAFCRDGVCTTVFCGDSAVDENEQCDDGNQISGDGCEKDCTFSCEMDSDCSDGNVCNGLEICDPNNHFCVSGEELDCTPQNECEALDRCDPVLGCVFKPIDGDGDGWTCEMDCQDDNAAVHPEANETCNGIDDNCNGYIDETVKKYFYADCDGDGYAANDALRVAACEIPPDLPESCIDSPNATWTDIPPNWDSRDCLDSNNKVFPGQTEYFSEPYTMPIPVRADVGVDAGADAGEGSVFSFDYDCDGMEKKKSGAFDYGRCATSCSIGSGFAEDSIPECGEEGVYYYCKTKIIRFPVFSTNCLLSSDPDYPENIQFCR